MGLIWGLADLTGHRTVDIPETVDRLITDRLPFTVHDTSAGNEYTFPTSF